MPSQDCAMYEKSSWFLWSARHGVFLAAPDRLHASLKECYMICVKPRLVHTLKPPCGTGFCFFWAACVSAGARVSPRLPWWLAGHRLPVLPPGRQKTAAGACPSDLKKALTYKQYLRDSQGKRLCALLQSRLRADGKPVNYIVSEAVTVSVEEGARE